MDKIHSRSLEEIGAQYVIAVFDDWDALQAVLDDMSAGEFDRFGTLLHARKEDLPPAMRRGLLKEITELQFVASRQRISCTKGEVAAELAARLAHGARSLGDALHSWLSADQAWQLQSHIEKGRAWQRNAPHVSINSGAHPSAVSIIPVVARDSCNGAPGPRNVISMGLTSSAHLSLMSPGIFAWSSPLSEAEQVGSHVKVRPWH